MPQTINTHEHAGLDVEILYDDQTGSPIPVSVQIGTVSITPRGEATLKLAFTTRVLRGVTNTAATD